MLIPTVDKSDLHVTTVAIRGVVSKLIYKLEVTQVNNEKGDVVTCIDGHEGPALAPVM